MKKTLLALGTMITLGAPLQSYSHASIPPPIMTEQGMEGVREYLMLNNALPDGKILQRLTEMGCGLSYTYSTVQELLGGVARIWFDYHPQKGFVLRMNARYFNSQADWAFMDANQDGIIESMTIHYFSEQGRQVEHYHLPADLKIDDSGMFNIGKVNLALLQQAYVRTLEQIVAETKGKEGCIN